MKKISVIGAGQMGRGIAQVCATSGFQVVLFDISDNQLQSAKNEIKASIEKLGAKGKLTDGEQKNGKELIHYTANISESARCDLVIEAVSERENLKKEIFKILDEMCDVKTIFATNTSSLPITRLAANTKRPEKFIGLHFMNPVPLMQLVEIISGLATSSETLTAVQGLTKCLGKTITTSKDYPGFVVNRILMPMINEAFHALMQNVATPQDIDLAMKLGTNQPMGPLALADFIGLDTCYEILNVMHRGFGDPKYAPSPLLVQYVEAGWLGKKTKQGVYSY